MINYANENISKTNYKLEVPYGINEKNEIKELGPSF